MIDAFVFRTIAIALAALALLGLGGIIVLAAFEKPIPDPLQLIAGGAVTALGTLLVKPPEPRRPEGADWGRPGSGAA